MGVCEIHSQLDGLAVDVSARGESVELRCRLCSAVWFWPASRDRSPEWVAEDYQ